MALTASERFSRQLPLPGVGEEGQRRLAEARLLIVGAGGLGSALIPALAAAGVGCLRIVDFDAVSLSNLNRQILYRPSDIGRPKAEAAAEWVRAFYPECSVEACPEPLEKKHLIGMDLAIDATDNYAARLLLDTLTEAAGIPMVHAAVEGLRGEVATFRPGGVRYRCLFGAPEDDDAKPAVLGAAVAVVGALEATEVIKQLLALTGNLTGRLLTVDLSAYAFQTFDLE